MVFGVMGLGHELCQREMTHHRMRLITLGGFTEPTVASLECYDLAELHQRLSAGQAASTPFVDEAGSSWNTSR